MTESLNLITGNPRIEVIGGGKKIDAEELRRLGLLDEIPPAARRRRLLEELRVKDIEELPQCRRDSLVRNLILGGVKGRVSIGGKRLDLKAETRELGGE